MSTQFSLAFFCICKNKFILGGLRWVGASLFNLIANMSTLSDLILSVLKGICCTLVGHKHFPVLARLRFYLDFSVWDNMKGDAQTAADC